jgi:hypothetical protein
MTIITFARFFVRFNALAFAFWAIYALIDFPAYYRNYRFLHEFPIQNTEAAQDFWCFVLKIALQLLAAVFLFGKTDRTISLLSHGQWSKIDIDEKPESNHPHEPSRIVPQSNCDHA